MSRKSPAPVGGLIRGTVEIGDHQVVIRLDFGDRVGQFTMAKEDFIKLLYPPPPPPQSVVHYVGYPKEE